MNIMRYSYEISYPPNKENLSDRTHDNASSTIFGAGIIVILLIMISGILEYSLAVITRHTAEAAADLAALAGAQKFYLGSDIACAQAAQIAKINASTQIFCTVEGVNIYIVVEKTIQFFGTTFTTHAKAQAGPLSSSPN